VSESDVGCQAREAGTLDEPTAGDAKILVDDGHLISES